MRERQQVLGANDAGTEQYVRQTLLPQWKSLPAPRRQVMMQHLQAIAGPRLTRSAKEKLNDPVICLRIESGRAKHAAGFVVCVLVVAPKTLRASDPHLFRSDFRFT